MGSIAELACDKRKQKVIVSRGIVISVTTINRNTIVSGSQQIMKAAEIIHNVFVAVSSLMSFDKYSVEFLFPLTAESA